MSVPQLVFTVALKAELPLDRLARDRLSVHTLKQLRAEGAGLMDQGTGVIITGIGVSASTAAAEWIAAHLDHPIVVNLGTAGATSGHMAPGDWIVPGRVIDESASEILLDTRIPFPWPTSLSLKRGGTLRSVKAPEFEADGGSAPELVDMEAFWQAAVFKRAGVCFHVLKCVSDHAGSNGDAEFAENLSLVRDRVAAVFGFLKRPGPPDIAVVIPVYNRAQRIVPCVASVLAQTLPAREIVVVDDGSSDDTAKALAGFSGQIKTVTLSENKGVSLARNAGVAVTSSPWISFLDSDDLWTENKLADQWRFITTYPFYEIFQSEEVWYRRGVRVNPRVRHQKPAGWIWRRCLDLCLVSPSSVTMTRDLFLSSGGFDGSLPACEDYDLWIRIARNHPVGLDPSPSVIKHGGHDDQLSRAFPAIDQFRVQALKKALDVEGNTQYRNELKTVLARKISILAEGARKRRKPDRARYYESLLDEEKAGCEPDEGNR